MENKHKIIIVDDHDMFREGLKLLLKNRKLAEVIAEASNGKEFIDLLDTHNPDVVLLDIAMPEMDGIEATKQALVKRPDLKILILSMFGDEEYYYKLIQAGIKGFVVKTSGINELDNAIREVASNNFYFSPELLQKIIVKISEPDKKQETELVNKELNKLSTRELEVLKHIANGLSNEEIAEKMHLSPSTIKTHRANLLQKTECNNTASLVMTAIKNKIIVV